MLNRVIAHRTGFWLVPYILGLAIGYLVGSFPTAYLIVKRKARLDVRTTGSGNVGARNAYDVTGSMLVGIAVFVLDALKGVAAVLVASRILNPQFYPAELAAVGAVLGHNYPVWTRFRGGRGLATGLGVMLLLDWVAIAIWCVLWTVGYVLLKNLHIANVAATIGTPVLLAIAPWNGPGLLSITGPREAVAVCTIVCLLILIRHAEPVSAILKS